MTRQELLSRLEPILSRINGSADDVSTLMTSPQFDEDYKVAGAGQLSTQNLDRLHLAAIELSRITDALLLSPVNNSDRNVQTMESQQDAIVCFKAVGRQQARKIRAAIEIYAPLFESIVGTPDLTEFVNAWMTGRLSEGALVQSFADAAFAHFEEVRNRGLQTNCKKT